LSDIPRVMVLTHANKIDSKVGDDISNLFYNVKIYKYEGKAREEHVYH
jgi:hypothetical protein